MGNVVEERENERSIIKWEELAPHLIGHIERLAASGVLPKPPRDHETAESLLYRTMKAVPKEGLELK